MSTYAIGDIQGCFVELQALLKKIDFDPKSDRLWIAGDLVNRGEQSADVLRFLKQLNAELVIVLGNHDLHLLAVADGEQQVRDKDTFQDILHAPDRDELLSWLRAQQLFHYDENLGFCMVHAGLPPQWDLATAQACAEEIETILHSDDYPGLLANIYGNEPNLWSDNLKSWERYRYIVNAFTRMRYCDEKGALDFSEKGPLGSQPNHLTPWFEVADRQSKDLNIVFGHWAALIGQTHHPKVHALDTGCSWGYQLTAMRLEDGQRFSVNKH
jgi:bis(5'-nucleosyl)-tetraphosphatase (symmetrical)